MYVCKYVANDFAHYSGADLRDMSFMFGKNVQLTADGRPLYIPLRNTQVDRRP